MPQQAKMKALINRLTSYWVIAGVYMAFCTWMASLAAAATRAWPLILLAALLGVISAGLLLRLQWARRVAVPVLVFMVLFRLYGLVALKFSWSSVAYVAGISTLAYYLWTRPDHGFFTDATNEPPNQQGEDEAEEESGSKSMISLVQLRTQPRYLEAAVLANALSAAWGLNIVGSEGEDPEEADGFVVGDNPLFIVMLSKPVDARFIVHNHEQNYFDEAVDVAEHMPNLRFAEIIRDHQAWLAVDLIQVEDTKLGQDEAYRLIGKAVSALADDEVLAILCPQHRFFNLWSPELESLLCSESPLDALQEEVKAPVFGVPDGDKIEQAIAEARRRWPEFVARFQQRDPEDERYLVKAPFLGEDGQTEHMWLQVFGLEPDYIHGHLMNHPMHTTKLKQGSQVEVPVAELSDWVCPDAEGNPMGNFTFRVVKEAAQAKWEA